MTTESALGQAELYDQQGCPPFAKERDEAAAKHMNTTGHSYQACTSGHSNQKKVVLTNHASPKRTTEQEDAVAKEKHSKYDHWTTHQSVFESEAGPEKLSTIYHFTNFLKHNIRVSITKIKAFIDAFFTKHKDNQSVREDTYQLILMMYHPDKKLAKSFLEVKQRDANSIRNAVECRDVLKFVQDLDALYQEETNPMQYAGGDGHRRLLADTVLALVLAMREEYVGSTPLNPL